MTTDNFTTDQWQNTMDKLMAQPPDDPGMTANEMAKRYGRTDAYWRNDCRQKVADGLLVAGKALRAGKDGRMMRQDVYRPKEP